MKELLVKLNDYIKALLENNSEFVPERIELEALKESYNKECLKKGKVDTLNYIVNSMKLNKHESIYILSVLHVALKDKDILLYIIEILINNTFNVYELELTQLQILCNSTLLLTKEFEEKLYIIHRKLNKKIVSIYENNYNIRLSYVPLNKRNKKRIVIVTNQILSMRHAPTRVISEIWSCLSNNLGYEVLLVSIPKNKRLYDEYCNWNKSSMIVSAYVEDFNGYFGFKNDDGSYITGYQLCLDTNNYDEQIFKIQDIYNFNPLFIWYMGGLVPLADLFCKMNTVVGLKFSNQLPISEAQIITRYLKKSDASSENMEKIAEKYNQKIIDFKIPYIPEDTGIKEFINFGFPKDAFSILIIGNRLNSELTLEFIELLEKIIKLDDRICFLFIGMFEPLKGNFSDDLISKTYFYGYTYNLLKTVKLGKLFLNPPRGGGGAGAVCSLFSGIPVITLDNCDIAITVGEDFICRGFEDMLLLVDKYIHDSSFYKEMSEKALLRAEKEKEISLSQELRVLIDKIINEIVESEKKQL